jgi:hypothetical protein
LGTSNRKKDYRPLIDTAVTVLVEVSHLWDSPVMCIT